LRSLYCNMTVTVTWLDFSMKSSTKLATTAERGPNTLAREIHAGASASAIPYHRLQRHTTVDLCILPRTGTTTEDLSGLLDADL
jgi:hypothetical protein